MVRAALGLYRPGEGGSRSSLGAIKDFQEERFELKPEGLSQSTDVRNADGLRKQTEYVKTQS